jgi:hypothetical protein
MYRQPHSNLLKFIFIYSKNLYYRTLQQPTFIAFRNLQKGYVTKNSLSECDFRKGYLIIARKLQSGC